ncbi:MAG: phospho-sugar mutase [Flavobacteriales bacterium]|nr:phospho-sugar mutase [Flavobacteriales bacterium]
MTTETQERIAFWKSTEFDAETRNEVAMLEAQDPVLLEDSFYKNLSFGTGGLRGEMGVGTNRMNQYIVSMATQGLADYLKKQFDQGISVAIAYDSRNRSTEFARRAAEVLSANGIEVYLSKELRPTPLLSYAVRHLACQAGIVITASHNPKEYNGYKVYWEDGGQLVPPHDQGIISCVREVTSPSKVKSAVNEALIHPIPDKVEESYYRHLEELLLLPKDDTHKAGLKLLYTSLHGTGITMIPEALKRAGFHNVDILDSQAEPNGDFPTVDSPNPEERSAMKFALEKGEELGSDFIIGTDPDTDRVGIGIRNAQGELELINGNQAAALLIHFLLENLSEDKKQNGFIAKTIVTSDLLKDMADAHGVPCYETLTGFKYIAELIRLHEGKKTFIGGGEESYGYLVGDHVRDKDAVISTVMLCEMAAWARSKNTRAQGLLAEIYSRYGLYREALVSLVKKGKSGAEEIQSIMEGFRSDPPTELAGTPIVQLIDYQRSMSYDLRTRASERIELPKSNVIQFLLEDGSKVTARPSGTEPKIKYYLSVKEELNGNLDSAWKRAGERIRAFETALGL